MLSDIYGYAPTDRMVGGVNIEEVVTDFGKVGIKYNPQMPTDEIYLVEMSVCKPVFCPANGQAISDTPVAVTTAQKGGFLYAQVGLDYGAEEYHGSITGLATA
jgi:hypothetical protein